MDKDAQAKANAQNKQKMPASLFELLIFLIKNFIKTLPQRLIFALITGVVVLIVHTYLMVVQNEGFRLDYNTKFLKYILMTNGSSSVNVTLFWMLISALFWGTIAQIRGLGIKVFFFKQIDNFAKLMSDIFEKPGTVQLSMFLGSICTGIVLGIILSNPAMSILLSIFIFMAVSARGTSLLILIIYLTWSDLQRLFRINPKKAFYIDIVSMILRGISIGLLLFAFTPYVKYGNVVQYIVLLAFIGLLILNILKKTKPNIASFLLLLGGALLITSTKVFADDGGWKESGGTFRSWVKTEGAWEAIKRGLQPASGAFSMALGFIPVLGDFKDAQEALLGIDMVTGEKLSIKDRFITAGAMFVPVVNGKALREGIGLAADGAEIIARHGDEAVDIVRHGDDILDSTRAGEKAIDGYEAAGKIAKNTDNVTDAAAGAGKVKIEITSKDQIDKKLLDTKPKMSKDPEKWIDKGGKITIDENGTWTYHDWEGNSVSYPDGYPDFKSAGMVKQEVPIGEFKNYPSDFNKADELAPNGPKSDESTWHHHQDLTTMQEVDKFLHKRFTHRGGMSGSKKS